MVLSAARGCEDGELENLPTTPEVFYLLICNTRQPLAQGAMVQEGAEV